MQQRIDIPMDAHGRREKGIHMNINLLKQELIIQGGIEIRKEEGQTLIITMITYDNNNNNSNNINMIMQTAIGHKGVIHVG